MKRFILILVILISLSSCIHAKKIGLLIVATGKYITFVKPLIDSAELYFCRNHEVTYFVFTDGIAPKTDNIVSIYQRRLGWPYDTLMRLSMYVSHEELLKNMDYLFACDADMVFVNTIGDEILSDRVATQHPADQFILRRPDTYESRKSSTAYTNPDEPTHYLAGGFNGGTAVEFLKMAKTITSNINKDLENNIIAVWHDESHINRYFIDHPPTLILSQSYCYPQNKMQAKWFLLTELTPRLIALDKNHAQIRN